MNVGPLRVRKASHKLHFVVAMHAHECVQSVAVRGTTGSIEQIDFANSKIQNMYSTDQPAAQHMHDIPDYSAPSIILLPYDLSSPTYWTKSSSQCPGAIRKLMNMHRGRRSPSN
ncbi:MAG: hypothetical protein Q9182_003988 [Xanthomendoza sp. 2 TL-2023]